MGRGLITQNLGEGQYAIRIVPARDIDQMITDLNNRVSALTVEIAPLQVEADALTVQINSKLSEITALITEQHTLDPTDPRYIEIDAELRSIIADAEELKQQRLAFYREIALLRMKQFSLEKRAEQLTVVDARLGQEQVVWCTDYSTGLSGDVATMEINGEPDHILIQPGGTGGLGGKLNPVITQSVAQSCLNFAIHPGWQKWKPTYRVGIITDIDRNANTASVSLDPAYSHYGGPSINQLASLTNVPIDYMSCDAAAFSGGDRVVVQFTNQSAGSPVVIGFETNPKECTALAMRWRTDIDRVDIRFYSEDITTGPLRSHTYSNGTLEAQVNGGGVSVLPLSISGQATQESGSSTGVYTAVPAMSYGPVDTPWLRSFDASAWHIFFQVYRPWDWGTFSGTANTAATPITNDGTYTPENMLLAALSDLLPDHGEWMEIVIREPGKLITDPSLEILYTSSKITMIDTVNSGFNSGLNRWEVWGYLDDRLDSSLIGTYP